jgi:hypothetical protein
MRSATLMESTNSGENNRADMRGQHAQMSWLASARYRKHVWQRLRWPLRAWRMLDKKRMSTRGVHSKFPCESKLSRAASGKELGGKANIPVRRR